MPGWEIINKQEKQAINKLFEEGGCLFAHGFHNVRKKFHVREFEKKLGTKFNCKHVLAVSSGTSAIKIALKALGVKPGHEVITQAFNFVATVEAIIEVGATPIICNVDDTLNMCEKDLKDKITKKTKVIIPVHMLGVSVDLTKILNIAKKNKIKVLEDNCEAVGAKYKRKYLGTLGDMGIFSFDFSKTITTGEGGAVLTNNSKLDKYCREYHDHGHQNNKRYPRGRDTVGISGFNYRMTEMQAVVGKTQLTKLNYILKENKLRYQILEKSLGGVIKVRKIPKNSTSIYDTFIFTVKEKNKKKEVIEFLKKNIGTKNLPDAIKWHCAYFWKHMLTKKQIKNSIKTKNILEANIAIPILLKQSKKKYSEISKKLQKILLNNT